MNKLVRQVNHDIVEALAARRLEGFPNRRAVQEMLRDPAEYTELVCSLMI